MVRRTSLREFYQHILFDFPHVSKHIPFKKDSQKIKWNHNPEHLTAWQTGQTGIPIVDAGMRQLYKQAGCIIEYV